MSRLSDLASFKGFRIACTMYLLYLSLECVSNLPSSSFISSFMMSNTSVISVWIALDNQGVKSISDIIL